MNRGIKTKQVIALFVVSLLLAGIVNLAWRSFAANTITVRAKNSGGTITNLTTKAVCSSSSGCTYTMTGNTGMQAAAKTGFSFRGWDSGNDGTVDYTTNPMTFANTKSWNLTAVFQRYIKVVVEPTEGGVVNDSKGDITCPQVGNAAADDCWDMYDTSSTAYNTLTVTPKNTSTLKYKFAGWELDNGANGTIDSRPTSTSLKLMYNNSYIAKAKFTYAYPPSCTLTPSPASITKGATTTMSWRSVNGKSTTATSPSGWSGSTAATGSKIVAPSATTTYTLNVAGTYGGSSTCSATVNVTNPPVVPPPVTKPPTKYTPPSGGSSSQPQPQSNYTAPIEDTTPPSDPANLVASYVADENSISLTWDASTDESIVEGYELERKLKSEAEWKKFADAVTEEYTDFDFVPNSVYEYRVRAYDQKKNLSGYSNVAEVTTGEFKPNVTVKDGGSVADSENKVSVNFPSDAVFEDLYILIEKISEKTLKNVDLGKNTRLVGDIYSVRAKNSKGEEITQFKTQITLKFKTEGLKGVNEKSIRLAVLGEDNRAAMLHTSYNPEQKVVQTLTDHFSTYFMTAPTLGFWSVFIKVIIWILIIASVVAGGYFGWKRYQLKTYQKEHQEDYIYKH